LSALLPGSRKYSSQSLIIQLKCGQPPRPWTSHVRWIELDANIPDYVFVAIEQEH